MLIAEDDLTSRILLRKVLEKWGYDVTVTATAPRPGRSFRAPTRRGSPSSTG